jgi:transposase
MRIDLENLPSDADLLHRLVRDMASVVEDRDGEIERLRGIIKQLQRAQFGRRSEQLDDEQLPLGLNDTEAAAARPMSADSTPNEISVPAPRASARTALPEHLPRADVHIDAGHDVCPHCGGMLHSLGESVSEQLDWKPARLCVIRTHRPKYACRTCQSVVQSLAPDRISSGGMATPAMAAQVLVAKYCDHTPLYRQAQIFARHGVDLARSTLADWVGGACWWLKALHERLQKQVLSSSYLFADDTPVPVLEPGRGCTRTGRFWVYARQQAGWNGAAAPAAVYIYEPDRRGERPLTHLKHFSGVVHVDGYAGFEALTAGNRIVLAACWVHMRRNFYEVAKSTASPIAAEALRRIAGIYAVEATIRGHSPPHRLAARREQSRPLVQALKDWLEAQLLQVAERSKLAEAIRYALSRWTALTRFLKDGCIEMDTNPVERAIRPVALGRKNHLFAGSNTGGHRWAIISSLVETCKMNGVEPYAYIRDVLERMVNGHPVNRLDDLLPWNWKAHFCVNP